MPSFFVPFGTIMLHKYVAYFDNKCTIAKNGTKYMFYNIQKCRFLRNGYISLLFAREKCVKICVFQRKILILHTFLR